MRIEKDKIGEKEIPDNCYWGIHTARAIDNFSISGYKIPSRMLKALAMVKKAAAEANQELKFLVPETAVHILNACNDIINGELNDQFPVDAVQGGAGTSSNMNINEVIANRALEYMGKMKGEYNIIHPIDHINKHQSTNDVYPTALKIAMIFGLRDLSNSIAELQGNLQKKESEFSSVLSIGRTEFQDAVPITLGSQFATFAEAYARDRWRTFKCEERLRTVNIGGTAVGTGLTAPRAYIFLVIEKLRQITGLGLARAEQVMDATANLDPISEVSGMLNAHSCNLIKIAQDLRILHYLNEISLPAVQVGSSIMPGKVNPVIIEAVISVGLKVSANDKLLNDCISRGTLQINEFCPMIAFAMLESIEMLININTIFAEHIAQITANPDVCRKHFEENITIITAFLPYIGYEKAEKIVNEFSKSENKNFREYLETKLDKALVDKVLAPHNLMSLGFKK